MWPTRKILYTAVMSRLSVVHVRRKQRTKPFVNSSFVTATPFVVRAEAQYVNSGANEVVPVSTRTQTKSYGVLRTSERRFTPSEIQHKLTPVYY